MVNIVGNAGAGSEGEDIVNGGDNIGDTDSAVIVNIEFRGAEHGIVTGFGFNANRNGCNEAAA